MTTQNILDLAHTASDQLDMSIHAAENALHIYIQQLETLESRNIDEDDIAPDDAEFLLGCLKAGQHAQQGDRRLDDVITAAQELADHDAQREHLIHMRDKAIIAAMDAGVPRQAIADAAGVSRNRIQQIKRES